MRGLPHQRERTRIPDCCEKKLKEKKRKHQSRTWRECVWGLGEKKKKKAVAELIAGKEGAEHHASHCRGREERGRGNGAGLGPRGADSHNPFTKKTKGGKGKSYPMRRMK